MPDIELGLLARHRRPRLLGRRRERHGLAGVGRPDGLRARRLARGALRGSPAQPATGPDALPGSLPSLPRPPLGRPARGAGERTGAHRPVPGRTVVSLLPRLPGMRPQVRPPDGTASQSRPRRIPEGPGRPRSHFHRRSGLRLPGPRGAAHAPRPLGARGRRPQDLPCELPLPHDERPGTRDRKGAPRGPRRDRLRRRRRTPGELRRVQSGGTSRPRFPIPRGLRRGSAKAPRADRRRLEVRSLRTELGQRRAVRDAASRGGLGSGGGPFREDAERSGGDPHPRARRPSAGAGGPARRVREARGGRSRHEVAARSGPPATRRRRPRGGRRARPLGSGAARAFRTGAGRGHADRPEARGATLRALSGASTRGPARRSRRHRAAPRAGSDGGRAGSAVVHAARAQHRPGPRRPEPPRVRPGHHRPEALLAGRRHPLPTVRGVRAGLRARGHQRTRAPRLDERLRLRRPRISRTGSRGGSPRSSSHADRSFRSGTRWSWTWRGSWSASCRARRASASERTARTS